LLEVLGCDFRASAEKAGAWLCCAPGCSDCCHGPFPITRLDVWRLRRGLAELRERDPRRAEAVRRRAESAAALLRPGFPGEAASGRLGDDERAMDLFFARHGELPCPALDPATGCCDLYAARPVSCRTYGPPARFGGRDVPPCDLCFRGADAATIEACRFEPDAQDLEQTLLAALGVVPGEDWETLVAFALLPVEAAAES
jgi:Fe-S-cluster containining protein